MEYHEAIVLYGVVLIICIIWLYILFVVGGCIATYFKATGFTWWAVTIVSMCVIGSLTHCARRVIE